MAVSVDPKVSRQLGKGRPILLLTYLHIQEWRRLGTPMVGGTKSNGAPLPAPP